MAVAHNVFYDNRSVRSVNVFVGRSGGLHPFSITKLTHTFACMWHDGTATIVGARISQFTSADASNLCMSHVISDEDIAGGLPMPNSWVN